MLICIFAYLFEGKSTVIVYNTQMYYVEYSLECT